MEEKVAMELLIDMLKKAGMEEYEALALICQLLEEEAFEFVFTDLFYDPDKRMRIIRHFPA